MIRNRKKKMSEKKRSKQKQTNKKQKRNERPKEDEMGDRENDARIECGTARVIGRQ